MNLILIFGAFLLTSSFGKPLNDLKKHEDMEKIFKTPQIKQFLHSFPKFIKEMTQTFQGFKTMETTTQTSIDTSTTIKIRKKTKAAFSPWGK